MGVHTWVYANRKTYDEAKVNERSLEMLKEEQKRNNAIIELNEKAVTSAVLRDQLKKAIKEYIFYIQAIGLCNSDKEYIKALTENTKSKFKIIYGEHAFHYAKYYFHHCGREESLYQMTTNFNRGIDLLVLDEHDTDYLFESALCELYQVGDWLDIHVEYDSGFFGFQTEFHDPFRMDDKIKDLFLTRDDLESYIFDRDTEDVSVYDHTLGRLGKNKNTLRDHYIRKSENYDLFVNNTTQILNVIYEKYPDAFIYLA